MKQLRVEQNTFKWYNGLTLLAFISLFLVPTDINIILAYLLYSLISISFLISAWFSFFKNYDYFQYCDHAIRNIKMDGWNVKDLLFKDISNIYISDTLIEFNYLDRKLIKQSKEKKYSLNLNDYRQKDIADLKGVFNNIQRKIADNSPIEKPLSDYNSDY